MAGIWTRTAATRLVIVCGAHPVCPSALVVALKAIFVRSRSRVAISEKGLTLSSRTRLHKMCNP